MSFSPVCISPLFSSSLYLLSFFLCSLLSFPFVFHLFSISSYLCFTSSQSLFYFPSVSVYLSLFYCFPHVVSATHSARCAARSTPVTRCFILQMCSKQFTAHSLLYFHKDFPSRFRIRGLVAYTVRRQTYCTVFAAASGTRLPGSTFHFICQVICSVSHY
jgi:hypothetical protein